MASETIRSLELQIDGEPVAKGRPRFSQRRAKDGQPYAAVVTPAKTRAAEEAVAWIWKARHGAVGPLAVPLTVWLHFAEGERDPQRWQDLDNLAKLVLDALNGVAWVDDRLIEELHLSVVRNYPEPGTVIRVEERR